MFFSIPMSKLHFDPKRAETPRFSILTAKSEFFVCKYIFEALNASEYWRIYQTVSLMIKYEMSAFTGKNIINFKAKLIFSEKMKIEEKTNFFEKKSQFGMKFEKPPKDVKQLTFFSKQS